MSWIDDLEARVRAKAETDPEVAALLDEFEEEQERALAADILRPGGALEQFAQLHGEMLSQLPPHLQEMFAQVSADMEHLREVAEAALEDGEEEA